MSERLDRIDELLEELHDLTFEYAMIDDKEQAKIAKFCEWLSHRVHLARQADYDQRIKGTNAAWPDVGASGAALLRWAG